MSGAQLSVLLSTSSAPVDLILLMIFGHFLCDYPLQTDKIAVGKCPGSDVAGLSWGYWMAGHCGTHALSVALLSGQAWLGAAEFAAHFLIDLLKCRKSITMAVDQSLHLLCKVVWGISLASLA